MTPVDWSDYTIEYEEATNVLLDNMIRSVGQSSMVFPTIFLYRHYIELKLKEIILNNWEYLEISERFPKGYDIYELWEKCREGMLQTDKLVDPKFAESHEYIEQIIQAYDILEADLGKFAEIDPGSEHFRYPVDSQGNPIVVDERLLIELLQELLELVGRIGYSLDGISTGIHTILQDKYAV